MSGIPTNIITIQMPPGSDPAGGEVAMTSVRCST